MAFHFEKVERFIYILELEGGNYYVGQTDNLESRFSKHERGKGSQWTQIYKPISMVDVIGIGVCTSDEAIKKENEVTLQAMEKYGWEKVRGGDFASANEMTIYIKLKNEVGMDKISFRLAEPKVVKQEHIFEFTKGMNRSKVKLDILNNLDKTTKIRVLASISGVFGSATNTKDIELIEKYDCGKACDDWFEKHGFKFPVGDIPYGDILQQFNKLKSGKVRRLRKVQE
ncbi:GIY-YIG nuclease family protein (plasmid) [Rossellomorea sp. AcN35-11]|nr:GIY-YIG nuclease family protein [Rossellomorea aquimaris]WJV31981.1 GIY-YIG nuclease family protein [Rossellomorea sp. AcN35-11]